MHVGDQLVERLIGYGVRRIFGCPGGQTLPMYNGIARRPGEIEHVLMHDERSGAMAADAYARFTGQIGVCDATVGPGASNLVSGLVEAYTSSSPVLAIVPDIPRAWEHRRAFGSASQAFEQRKFLEGCVKYYGRVQTPGDLAEMLQAAIHIATSGRPGPVVLEIPDDVFESEAVAATFAPDPEVARFPRMRTAPAPSAVAQAVELLANHERPMIVVGGGALHAGAEVEVTELVELLNSPVATSLTGKGIIPETHPLSVGVIGRFGVPMANAAMEDADCVIFIGCKTGQGTTLNWTLPFLDVPVVHIDADPFEVGRNYHNTTAMVSDAKLGVADLVAALRKRPVTTRWDHERIAQMRDAWWNGPIAYKQEPVEGVLKPQDVVRMMRKHMTDEDIFASDASLSSGWIGGRWQLRAEGRRLLAPRGLASLGWGLPAAIGLAEAFGTPDATGDERPPRVVCLAGDGGWGYSLTEVETAARRGLPLVCVVINNSTLGWIKHSAQNRYPDGVVSQDFTDVSYADAAKALGAEVAFVEDLDGLDAALEKAFADPARRPWVIEARSCAIETPVLPSRVVPAQPAGPRGGY
jgi:acetolactate synthase-1/2/3 large subunit